MVQYSNKNNIEYLIKQLQSQLAEHQSPDDINWGAFFEQAESEMPALRNKDIEDFIQMLRGVDVEPFAQIYLKEDQWKFCLETYVSAPAIPYLIYLPKHYFQNDLGEALHFAEIMGMQIWKIKTAEADFIVAGPHTNVPATIQARTSHVYWITPPGESVPSVGVRDIKQEN